MEYQVHYNQQDFGKRLRAIRKINKMTQEVLAEKLMLSVDSISNYENGKTTCMPEHIIHLCQIFHVSADYFLFGDSMKLEHTKDEYVERIIKLLSECSNFDKDRAYQMIRLLVAKPA